MNDQPITDQELDEIEVRCNAATPGPWVAGRGDVATIVDGYESKWIYAKDRYLAIASGYEIPNWEEVMANARFIAASRAYVPRLVAEVRRLRASAQNSEPVRHGRWTSVEYRPHVTGHHCSVCRYVTFSPGNYCLNCGAKMDAEKEEPTC